MKSYVVYDTKGDIYHRPVFDRNHEMARRSFGLSCKDGNSLLAQAPEDFILFCNGSFDEDTGMITPQELESVARGIDFKVNDEER